MFGHNGKNFVKTMLQLASSQDPVTGNLRDHINVVNDQISSPTYSKGLAKLLCEMIKTDRYGIYHASNEGFCSWYEFACEIFLAAGIQITVNPISSSDYKTKAIRPMNSKLDKSKLTEMGFDKLSSWQNALRNYFKD